MEPLDPQVRRDARAVVITRAAVLGGLIALGPAVLLFLISRMAGISGSEWRAFAEAVQLTSVVVGAAVTLWLLVRARQKGL